MQQKAWNICPKGQLRDSVNQIRNPPEVYRQLQCMLALKMNRRHHRNMLTVLISTCIHVGLSLVLGHHGWLQAQTEKCMTRLAFHHSGCLKLKLPSVIQLQIPSVSERKDGAGNLRLKHTNGYYTQVQAQLAVTGLKWCDFFVMCIDDEHKEEI